MIYPTPEQLDLFTRTVGAISKCEGVAIMNLASQAPIGTCAEMGSHRGRSAIMAAIGLVARNGVGTLHMVDPLYDMENLEAWSHSCQGHPDNAWCGARDSSFKDAVMNSVVSPLSLREGLNFDFVAKLHGDYSTHAIPKLYNDYGPFAYVFIDSNIHAYELLKEECDLLKDKMVMGGLVVFHDFGAECDGVERAYREMLQGGNFEEVSIDWGEIRQWVDSQGGEWTDGNASWHKHGESHPCLVGAVRRVK